LEGDLQTNQRAELTAVQRALEIVPKDHDIQIFTDSNYAINCCEVWYKSWLKNDWKTSQGGPVLNKDLVVLIRALIDERNENGAATTFQWIKGHSADPGNEAADRLAVAGAVAGRY
jgi:ribonuclease HI